MMTIKESGSGIQGWQRSKKRPGLNPPLPVPWIVRQGFGWTALLFILAFPLAAVAAVGAQELEALFSVITGFHTQFLSRAIFLIVLACPFWAGLGAAYSRTSSFILECVKWYLDHGELERAKSFAQAVDYQVWYREWKRNPWFRWFVVENGLVETSAKYAKYNRRLPAQ